ncbi:MAG: 30S ribosomal protein S4 [Sphaerobacteraceae bacterium]|nr:MAG: 30S ribosomal protein S4 [Sphaerobacteraceae bacterium]
MARYTGSKHKLSRREGVNLTGTRSRSLERRLNVQPGGRRRMPQRRISEYGRQLREKQKLKRFFGMLEKQFRNTFADAQKSTDPTGEALLKLLESRLDNVVYRLGFTPTSPMARQLVNHGHVLVNDKRVSIPSYRVKPGDTVKLRAKAHEIPAVIEALEETGNRVPSWLSREGNGPSGRMVSAPNPEEFTIPVDVDQIIAFYAR